MDSRRRHRTWVLAAALLVPALPRAAVGAGGGATAPASSRAAGKASPEDPADRPVRRARSGGDEDRRVGPGKNDTTDGWLRTLGALAVVVVLIFVVRALLKRLGRASRPAGRAGAIEVLARTPLDARQQVSLIRLGRRLVLVGSGPAGMSPLAEVSDPEEVEELLADCGAATRRLEPPREAPAGGAAAPASSRQDEKDE